ncbi:4481_t:CDS:2, partial [Acaulospora morrowiae]
EEEDNRSATLTTPDLTIDDLYHLVLNMQKGFQLQMNEMSTQISVSGTASSVRSVTRQMEKYGGNGKWFHN